jgi:multiple sugar transport system substrate-binding protein
VRSHLCMLFGVAVLLGVFLGSLGVSGARTTLEFYVYPHSAVVDALNHLIADYEKLNPDITVNLSGGDDYWEKLDIMLATGVVPDIIWMGDGQLETYVAHGALTDLDPLFRSLAVKIDTVPSLREMASVDGRLYFAPRDWGTWALYYSRPAFEESGVPFPDHLWDWDAYAKAAQRLTRFEGEQAVRQGSKSMRIWWWGSWVQLIWQAGAELTDPAMTEALPDIPKVTDAFQWAWELTYVYNATPDVSDARISNGRMAMDWDLPSKLFSLRKETEPENWGLTTFPKGRGPTGRHAAQTFVTGYAITAQSKQKLESAKFISFLLQPECQKAAALAGDMLPPSPALLKGWLFTPAVLRELGLPDTLPNLFEIVDKYSHPLPDLPRFEDFMNAINPIFNQVMDGNLAPRVAAEQAKTAAQPTLERR